MFRMTTHNGTSFFFFFFYERREKNQGPVVQSIINLTSLLMTNLLTAVAKEFQCKSYSCFFSSAKNINAFVLFQDRNFNVTLVNNVVKF